MTLSKNHCPLESVEQQRLILWADHKRIGADTVGSFLFAIPNGGSRAKTTARFSSEAFRMKREGIRPGVPDLMLAVPKQGYAGLFIEMKRAVKSLSRVSPEQKIWHKRLSDIGYMVIVAYGAKEAMSAICEYLGVEDVNCKFSRNRSDTSI